MNAAVPLRIDRPDASAPAHAADGRGNVRITEAAPIGCGAMGRVHLAVDAGLRRRVAVKRLRDDLARVPRERERFLAEARLTGQLDHPNVIPVHEVGVSEDGVPYFTMSLVDGRSLADWLADPAHPLGSPARIRGGIAILLEVCDALAYAHARGVLHRDVKPENVMVGEHGQVYVIDWGLARWQPGRDDACDSAGESASHAPEPVDDAVVGTPSAMAPELAHGDPERVDQRADVFGVGAILYEIAAGRSPYGASRDGTELFRRAFAGLVVPIEQATAGVTLPCELLAIVRRATAPDPAERHASVLELKSDLERLLSTDPSPCRRRQLDPGDWIVRRGEPSHAAYRIVAGAARVIRTDGPQSAHERTVQAGEVVGALDAALARPRTESVQAIGCVTVEVVEVPASLAGDGAGSASALLVRALAQRCSALESALGDAGATPAAA